MNHPENDKLKPIKHANDHRNLKSQISDSEKELDELILDRLVDNDLSPEEYRSVLKLVQEKPDGWRMLALAFLESQALENDLSEMRRDESYMTGGYPSATEGTALGEAEVQNGSSHPIDTLDSRQEKESIDRKSPLAEDLPARDQSKKSFGNLGLENSIHQEARNHNRLMHWTKQAIPAIAACIVIAFIATIYVREMQNQSGRMENVVTLPSDVDHHRNSRDGRNQNYIQLVGNNDGESMRAPVYDHETFDQKEAAEGFAKFTPRLREVLTSSGLNANERTHVMPIKDRDGNKIILPIKEFKLTPTKWEGYQ